MIFTLKAYFDVFSINVLVKHRWHASNFQFLLRLFVNLSLNNCLLLHHLNPNPELNLGLCLKNFRRIDYLLQPKTYSHDLSNFFGLYLIHFQIWMNCEISHHQIISNCFFEVVNVGSLHLLSYQDLATIQNFSKDFLPSKLIGCVAFDNCASVFAQTIY